jgi:hypothetical protein
VGCFRGREQKGDSRSHHRTAQHSTAQQAEQSRECRGCKLLAAGSGDSVLLACRQHIYLVWAGAWREVGEGGGAGERYGWCRCLLLMQLVGCRVMLHCNHVQRHYPSTNHMQADQCALLAAV